MFDVKPLPLSTLHQISAHVYNNQMVLKCERTLLNILDYDLFIRDNLIVDRVGLYLESVRYLLDPQDFSIFTDICFKLTDLIHEDMKIIKDNDFVLLCAAVIQASLVIATKRDGKMPITLKRKSLI